MNHSDPILYPVFAMVTFTFIFMFTVFIWRVRSVKTGKVRARYYKLMQGSDAPDHIVASMRHFSNLFETPVLFYVVSVIILVQKIELAVLPILGWIYFLARVIHAYIHVSYNNILHRLSVFWFGTLILLTMWIIVFMASI